MLLQSCCALFLSNVPKSDMGVCPTTRQFVRVIWKSSKTCDCNLVPFHDTNWCIWIMEKGLLASTRSHMWMMPLVDPEKTLTSSSLIITDETWVCIELLLELNTFVRGKLPAIISPPWIHKTWHCSGCLQLQSTHVCPNCTQSPLQGFFY